MKSLTVNTQKPYNIIIDENFNLFNSSSSKIIKGKKIAIITDENLNKLYKGIMPSLFKCKELFYYVIKAGENSKNFSYYYNIMNELAENGFTRLDTIVTFGGGVVGDLGGFIASTYMRGITLINIPTSLLAMVDSSVGGKTAINLSKGKNLCGTFYQPSLVYINLSLLKTLPLNEYLNGFGEILKYFYLGMVNYQDEINEELISSCLKIKISLVESDERDIGSRKLLNFGHTFGHALERLYDFKIGHGICVAKGILIALEVSSKVFGYNDELVYEYIKLASTFGFDLNHPFSVEDILNNILSDKKMEDDLNIDLILLNNVGQCEIVTMDLIKLRGILDEL